MNNGYILSFLLGVFLKIYDDFIDLHITNYPILFDISKIIIVITTYLLIDEYYILSIVIFFSLIISNYCKRFDDTFWDAYMYFVGTLCIINYNKIYSLHDFLSFKLIFVIFIPLFIYFEENMYREEFSYNKLTSRSYSILINTVIILVLEYFNLLDYYELNFFAYLIVFINSYFITNIIIQTFYVTYATKNEKLDESQEISNNQYNKNDDTTVDKINI